MEGQVKVTRVSRGLCIFNAQTGEHAYTNPDGFVLIAEDGAQSPIRENELVRDFTNRDGTRVAPQKIVMGRIYPLRRRAVAM